MKKGIIILVAVFLALVSTGCSKQNLEKDAFHVLPESLKNENSSATVQVYGKIVRVEGDTVTVELYDMPHDESNRNMPRSEKIEKSSTEYEDKRDLSEEESEEFSESSKTEEKRSEGMEDNESENAPVLKGSSKPSPLMTDSDQIDATQTQDEFLDTVEMKIDDDILLRNLTEGTEETISPAELDPGQNIIVIYDEEGNILSLEALEE